MIDDYDQVIALTEKLNAHLPITVYATPELLKTMEAKGVKCSRDQELTIDEVFYAGDMGGITCALRPDHSSQLVFVSSLTHLRIPKEHPLASEIRAYQKKRTIRLAIADGKLQLSLKRSKSKKKKGFGG